MMMLKDAKVWVIGDFPSVYAMKKGKVYPGTAGEIINDGLAKAGLNPALCHINYISPTAPRAFKWENWFCTKGQSKKMGYRQVGEKYVHPTLYDCIKGWREAAVAHKPDLIIALGNIACLAFTSQWGVNNWRGSQLNYQGIRVVPTISPDIAQKMWQWTYYIHHDFRRAAAWINEPFEPEQDAFFIRPNFDFTMQMLDVIKTILERADKPVPIGTDIETRFRHITCIGLATHPHRGICVPFSSIHQPYSYWEPDEELQIVLSLREILTHPNYFAVGQNWLYDRQYIAREWGIDVPDGFDTMGGWHIMWPGMEKSLGFISSMVLNHYVYWKDESGTHAPETEEEEDNYWRYNCKDAARTLEIGIDLMDMLDSMGKRTQYEMWCRWKEDNYRAMLRGVRVDLNKKNAITLQLMETIAEYEQWFMGWTECLTGGVPLVKKVTSKTAPWYRSPTQQAQIFYDLFGVKEVRNRTGGRTCDDEALPIIGKREPLLALVCQKLVEYNSLTTFLSNFQSRPIDWDGRIRCSYGVGMTETFRHTSSIDVFGYGTNLQNIPSGS